MVKPISRMAIVSGRSVSERRHGGLSLGGAGVIFGHIIGFYL